MILSFLQLLCLYSEVSSRRLVMPVLFLIPFPILQHTILVRDDLAVIYEVILLHYLPRHYVQLLISSDTSTTVTKMFKMFPSYYKRAYLPFNLSITGPSPITFGKILDTPLSNPPSHRLISQYLPSQLYITSPCRAKSVNSITTLLATTSGS